MLIDFLKTETSKEDLATCLRVIEEFKSNESDREWMMAAFLEWVKLEQMQEYLCHMVRGDDLANDTIRELERLGRA